MKPRKVASGNWNPFWEPFARLDPAWTEKVIAMAMGPAVSGVLDTKMIELIRVALDAVCMYEPGLRRHMRRAFEAGATREQIVAVLQLATMQGLHSMCIAAPILEEVEAAASKKSSSRKDKK
jgi:alkylhydroperoxidase/carboxymuconolactone decarboxylase family protein YurZ